jgi:serine/threonine protein kinase/ActR/RegA family two-component response regulator
MGSKRSGITCPPDEHEVAQPGVKTTRVEPLGARARSGRVLITDDQADLRRVWARALRREGHHVTEACDGASALAQVKAHTFDLVISDIRMPDMSGIELLVAIREVDPDLPVLLLTGDPELSTAMKAVELGALEYLAKPIDLGKLSASTARGVQLSGQRRASRRAAEELAEHRRSGERLRVPGPGQTEPSWTGALLAGRYRLGKLLGHGGMGSVYEAVREDLASMKVAVKVLRSQLGDRPDLIARFRREAETVAAINHPNIVQLLDFEAPADEPAFLVMERLQGAPLSQLIGEEGRFSAERACFVVTQVLAALAAAHEKSVVHRDLKPDNVFLTSIAGVRDIVKLLDFGIAKLGGDAEDQRLTQTGTVLGTPAYMSPEQARGAAVDLRSDIYGAGCMLYETLSGHAPYQADNYNALLFAIQQGEPEPLDSLRADLEPELVAAVRRAMARDPKDRYQSADAMAEALSLWARPSSGAASTPKPNLPYAPTLPSVPAHREREVRRASSTSVSSPAGARKRSGSRSGG